MYMYVYVGVVVYRIMNEATTQKRRRKRGEHYYDILACPRICTKALSSHSKSAHILHC